jgi:hypothetical protein
VRRLLANRRLYGIKIGPVWGVYLEDVESFMRAVLRDAHARPRDAHSARMTREAASLRNALQRGHTIRS